MEERDRELVRKLSEENQELRRLWEEHLELERKLDEFEHKAYLTTEEELERKKIQKLKLFGKDRMHQILNQHRSH